MGWRIMTNDLGNYYRRRHNDEQAAADSATNPEAAAIHRALAARYAGLAGRTPEHEDQAASSTSD